MSYVLHIFVIIEIYALVALALNIQLGYAGLVSVCQAAFFGIGAYSAALISLRLGVPFPLDVIAACVVATLIALCVAIPSLRTREEHFVVATLAFQLVISSILCNCVSWTGGPMGLPGIHRPSLFGWQVDSPFEFATLGIVICGMAFTLVAAINHSPYGRMLRCIREDEVFAQSNGKHVETARVMVFVLTALLAAFAGGLYAHYITFIDPTSFTLMESVFIMSIVVIGGAGSLWGPVLGALVLVSLPEMLRFVGIPSPTAANIRQILYGLALVACMLWRPQGLIGEYAFGKEAKTK